MELRLYYRVIMKRIWVIVTLFVAFGLSYLFFPHRPQPAYVANMRFTVGVRPEPTSGQYYAYDRYYTWLTAEYLLDDLAEVVKSGAFARDVAALAGFDIPSGVLQGATAAGKLHRILTISVTWNDQGQLTRLADAVVQNLQDRADVYFAQLSTGSAVISLIDPPVVSTVGPSLRQRLDFPLRLILTLVTGVALVFLLDYVDDTVRHGTDLEQLGVSVLAEVPSTRRWHDPFWRRRLLP